MSLVNSEGFVELLTNSSIAAGAAIETALPFYEVMFHENVQLMFITTFMGFIFATIGMPIGLTDSDTVRKHLGISLTTWLLLWPFKTLPVADINPISTTGASYELGIGPYVIARSMVAMLGSVTAVASFFTGDNSDTFVALSSNVLGRLSQHETIRGISNKVKPETMTSVFTYHGTCGALLNNKLKSGDPQFAAVPKISWMTYGLLGGNSLGITDNTDVPKLSEATDIQETNPFVSWFIDTPDVGASQQSYNLNDAKALLEKLHIGGGLFSTQGFRIPGAGNYISASNATNSNSGLWVTINDVQGYESALAASGVYASLNKVVSNHFNSNRNEDPTVFNAVNCYQMYLIANKSMYELVQVANDDFSITGLTSSASDNTNSLAGIEDALEESSDMSAAAIVLMSNDLLYRMYSKSEDNASKNGENKDGVIAWLKDKGGDAAQWVMDTGSTGIASYGEGKELLVKSYEQDITLPTVWGGCILFITFLFIIIPLITTVSLLFPGKADSSFAFIVLAAYVTLFLCLLTVSYAIYDSLAKAVLQTFTANAFLYASSPSTSLIAMSKGVQHGGLALVSVSAIITYIIIFGRSPILKAPGVGGSSGGGGGIDLSDKSRSVNNELHVHGPDGTGGPNPGSPSSSGGSTYDGDFSQDNGEGLGGPQDGGGGGPQLGGGSGGDNESMPPPQPSMGINSPAGPDNNLASDSEFKFDGNVIDGEFVDISDQQSLTKGGDTIQEGATTATSSAHDIDSSHQLGHDTASETAGNNTSDSTTTNASDSQSTSNENNSIGSSTDTTQTSAGTNKSQASENSNFVTENTNTNSVGEFTNKGGTASEFSSNSTGQVSTHESKRDNIVIRDAYGNDAPSQATNASNVGQDIHSQQDSSHNYNEHSPGHADQFDSSQTSNDGAQSNSFSSERSSNAQSENVSNHINQLPDHYEQNSEYSELPQNFTQPSDQGTDSHTAQSAPVPDKNKTDLPEFEDTSAMYRGSEESQNNSMPQDDDFGLPPSNS